MVTISYTEVNPYGIKKLDKANKDWKIIMFTVTLRFGTGI